MNVNVITVPKDKCPLDVIAEMGENSRNAWLFFDHNCKEDLFQKADDVITREGNSPYEGMTHTLVWAATDKFPETKLVIELFTGHDDLIGTWAVKQIAADDIAFEKRTAIPTEICFFKKEM